MTSAAPASRVPWPVAVLGLAAALLSAAFVVESQRHLPFQLPLLDSASYHHDALAMASPGYRATGPYWQPPLYPLLLSLLYRLGLRDMLAVRLFHALLMVPAVLLAWDTARRLAARRAIGVAAGAMTAAYGPLLFFFGQLMPTGLATLLDMAALNAAIRLIDRPTRTQAAVCGACFGLAALAVPNILVVVPLLLLWLWRGAGGSPSAARPPASVTLALLAALALCILPVTLRNHIVSGRWVPISTNGGINLYIGNNPNADETIAARPGLDWSRLVARPFREGGARDDADAQAWFLREVARYARSEPLAFVRGLGDKAWQCLNAREIPRNLDLYVFREHSRVLAPLVWRLGSFGFPKGVLLPLALVGIGLTARRSRAASFLAASIGAYALSVAAFFPSSRYVAPLVPALAVFAAMGLGDLWRRFRDRDSRRGRAIAAAAAAALLVNLPAASPMDAVDLAAEMRVNVGVALQTRGRTAEAIGQYEEALRLAPRHADAWFYLATAHRDLKHTDRAILYHFKAIACRPDHNRAMNDLAVIFFNARRTEEAINLLRRSLRVDPGDTKVMKNLAVALVAEGRVDEANAWFRKAGAPPVKAVTTAR